jgi:hypothetical protein
MAKGRMANTGKSARVGSGLKPINQVARSRGASASKRGYFGSGIVRGAAQTAEPGPGPAAARVGTGYPKSRAGRRG